MIRRIVRTGITNLRRDRSALLLTFALPIAFFTIFAMIFGAQKNQASTPKVTVLIADEDHSEASQRLVTALEKESALTVRTEPGSDKTKNEHVPPYTRETAEKAVREGIAPVAIVIDKGFGISPIAFDQRDNPNTKVELLCDSSDPIAPQVVGGMLQKAAMTSMPDMMADVSTTYMDKYLGLTPQQKSKWQEELQSFKKEVREREQKNSTDTTTSNAQSNETDGLIAFKKRDVLGETKKNPIVAFYVAGIGVMFLLFSASGAGGSLLDEADSGAMDRVLSTKVSMTNLLTGKLIYLTLLGSAQLTVMYVWAASVFKVELWSHIPGFLIMTVATSIASSTVGLLLASICRSRAQLGAVSTLVILSMSALGGSMFPRYIMPESMQKVGLITFNAWAIDGFQKVFWREEPIIHLWPQVAVLLGIALVLFAAARHFARRWEIS